MSKPSKRELEEWQYLVFALKDKGRLRLYCEASAANLIPPKRRWWIEILMDMWADPSHRWLNVPFTHKALVSASTYFSTGEMVAMLLPLPIVLGARRRAHYVGEGKRRRKG